MLFAIYCRDGADGGRLRAENRDAHLDHLKAQEDRLAVAGPLLADDGSKPVGSLLIIDCADRAAAEAFAAGDPYNQAGVFESVAIHPFRKVMFRDVG